MKICSKIGCPISAEKTQYADAVIEFLGTLINGKLHLLAIPEDKRIKTVNLLKYTIHKKKVTINFVQKLTGTLNFLNRTIIPERAFMKGMYKNLCTKNANGIPLKPYHHTYLKADFLQDCHVWLNFLMRGMDRNICRPFIDFSVQQCSYETLNFYSDSSRNGKLGMGAVYNDHWIVSQWSQGFVETENPSIKFLELYAVTLALIVWRTESRLQNCRVVIFCDNQAMLHMVNNVASS